MKYRNPKNLAEQLAGTGFRMIRAMISARQLVLDRYEAVERVLVRGRQSRDASAEEDGRFEESFAENCQPVGMVARPPASATVEAVVGHIGGDGANPYILATIDHRRATILDARGVTASDRDLVILYTDDCVVEIRDGKIRAGSLIGTTEQLPTWADFNDLRDFVRGQFDNITGHIHVTPAGPTTTITTSATLPSSLTPADAPVPVGTQKFEAE